MRNYGVEFEYELDNELVVVLYDPSEIEYYEVIDSEDNVKELKDFQDKEIWKAVQDHWVNHQAQYEDNERLSRIDEEIDRRRDDELT